MPWWSDQTESPAIFSFDHPFHGIAYGSDGCQGNVVGSGAANGVMIEVTASGFGNRPDLVDIPRGVDQGEPASGHRFDLGSGASGKQISRFEALQSPPNPVRPFWMSSRFVLEKNGVVVQ